MNSEFCGRLEGCGEEKRPQGFDGWVFRKKLQKNLISLIMKAWTKTIKNMEKMSNLSVKDVNVCVKGIDRG